MWFYYLLFLFIAFSSIWRFKQKYWVVFLWAFFLFLIAALRNENVDRDYLTYILNYEQTAKRLALTIEPTFYLFSIIARSIFDNVIFLFIIYAFLGVFIKIYAISKLSKELYLFSFLVYFSNFFLLHEMTQIRAGVAAAFILISLLYI
jgi:hypothetical protein